MKNGIGVLAESVLNIGRICPMVSSDTCSFLVLSGLVLGLSALCRGLVVILLWCACECLSPPLSRFADLLLQTVIHLLSAFWKVLFEPSVCLNSLHRDALLGVPHQDLLQQVLTVFRHLDPAGDAVINTYNPLHRQRQGHTKPSWITEQYID